MSADPIGPTTLPSPTLAKALAVVPAPPHGVLLAVGVERVTLPSDASAPVNPLDITSYGYEKAACGSVTAVAPATMVVLNEDPALPDVIADLPPFDAFQMLAARLDDVQWHLLTSDQGLGLSDLHGETQLGLFRALFPQGRLLIGSEDPALDAVPDAERMDLQDVSDQIGNARLRLGQTSHMYVHDKAGKTIFFSGDRPDAAGRLRIVKPKQDPNLEEHGVPLAAVVPNTPKPSDLKLDGATVQVPLAGLKTIADLVIRIGGLTKTELYADPHYAGRSVTIIGGVSSVPAGDLLQALALCVTGTYRRVGPAYVLTDDLRGVGQRRQRLAEWEETANLNQQSLRDQAGWALLERRASGARTLPSFGDALAMTPDQIKAEHPDESLPELPAFSQNNYAFDQLTPAQQDWARHIAADYEAQRSTGTLPDYLKDDNPQAADLTGLVELRSENLVQLILPGISQPIETRFVLGPTYMLYWPGEKFLSERQHEAAAKEPKTNPQPVSAPSLASVFTSWHRRAVLAHPNTTADVDALVVAMQKIGLNELWLDVFSDGVARIPGSELAPATPPVGPDILTEALVRTQGTRIVVYADMSLLPWGDTPSPALRDLDILGRDYRQAMIVAHQLAQEYRFDTQGHPLSFAPPPVPVSPASPVVENDLTILVRTLAAQRGLAGFVWEDAEADSDLGYTPEMRFSFLRAAHADPIDITTATALRLDARLPDFDDKTVENALRDRWSETRTQINAGLLRAMRSASDAAGLPILMEQGDGDTDWLASWDNLGQLPPPLRPSFRDNTYHPEGEVSVAARKQGRVALLRVSLEDADNVDVLVRTLKSDRKGVGWDGFVLDLADPAATRGATPLAALVRAATVMPVVQPTGVK